MGLMDKADETAEDAKNRLQKQADKLDDKAHELKGEAKGRMDQAKKDKD